MLLILLGEYQCVIESVASSDSAVTISAVTGSIQVRATVLETLGQYEISSTSINIPFLPAFHVMTPELHVSGMHPQTMLKVSANDRVVQELQVLKSFVSYLVRYFGYVSPRSHGRKFAAVDWQHCTSYAAVVSDSQL